MAVVPKYLTHYPNMDSELPFHIKVNQLVNGFESHRHDYLEFSYVIEGSGSETINGVKHLMLPGTFTLVMPYQFHEIHSDPGSPLQLFNCNFGIHLYSPAEQLPGIDWNSAEANLPSFVQVEDSEEQRRFQSVLEELSAEYSGAEPWRNSLIKAKLTEVLVRFDRLRRSMQPGLQEAAAAHAYVRKKPRSSVWQVIQYIHNHYRDDLTLSGLAERFGFSVPYLSELFKRALGQNFVTFVHDVRIRQACGLLISTEMSVLEIAMETGYGSYNTFARIFRESKGITPAGFRKGHLSQPQPLDPT
ncbi:AraC family transcriptional regulator [Paenibacillus radicis (ex Xue et al. 2023)]|uniref:AraC family transcriptional regulator n=1 Tax=Paenibacillus radicis (ex Xue et al. 2023) TaxID=2972489 RepID=A0ABT1YLI9_9BACL|nr:AraC family transcriptional regulator [Paenibacillus radicis (ex Xue et al. 2023)]MCR8634051.1 AraC family transcriptional regulator [Paenibacillus radicis (ex Xue et al. 2023)]